MPVLVIVTESGTAVYICPGFSLYVDQTEFTESLITQPCEDVFFFDTFLAGLSGETTQMISFIISNTAI